MDEAKSCENCNHAELMDATCHACKRNPDIDDDVTPFSAFNRNELGDNWEKRKMDDAKSCEIIMEVKKTPLILYKNKWKEEWSKTSKEGKGIFIGIIIILTNTLLGFILLQLNFNNNNNILIIVSLIGLDFYGIGFILLGFYGFKYVKLKIFKILLFSLFIFGILNLCYWNIFIWIF